MSIMRKINLNINVLVEADQDYFVFFTIKRALLQILKCGLWQIVEKNINCQRKKEKIDF